MSEASAYLESLIDECGGFSRFQALMFTFIMVTILIPNWSILMMTFAGAVPDWYCLYDSASGTNQSTSSALNTTLTSVKYSNQSYQQCHPENATTDTCLDYRFVDDMNTIVNEWTLICDDDWIASTIATIQMAGLLVSGVTAGHMADILGRKPTFFMSVAIMTVFNIVAGFSVSWQMYAAIQFMLGFGIGSCLTVFYPYLTEFIPARHRAITLATPAWPIWAAAFGLMSMCLHDWRYLHYATGVLGASSLLSWWIAPESFRYLVSHNRIEEAEKIVCRIARINGRPLPDLNRMRILVKEMEIDTCRTYTMKDLVTNNGLLKHTLLFGVGWLSCGYGYFAISFSVQSLSGNLYVNMLLLSAVEIPAQFSTYILTNKFGRKRTAIGFLVIAGLAGVVVAAVERTNLQMRSELINGFALVAKLAVAAAWTTLRLLTTETYPTVVRNIGYGLHSSLSKIGAMVAPQLVYLNKHVSGIMYLVFGGAMLISALSTGFVTETNGKPMEDAITTVKVDATPQCKIISSGHVNEVFDTRL